MVYITGETCDNPYITPKPCNDSEKCQLLLSSSSSSSSSHHVLLISVFSLRVMIFVYATFTTEFPPRWSRNRSIKACLVTDCTYCFSTATVVTGTRSHVTFIRSLSVTLHSEGYCSERLNLVGGVKCSRYKLRYEIWKLCSPLPFSWATAASRYGPISPFLPHYNCCLSRQHLQGFPA